MTRSNYNHKYCKRFVRLQHSNATQVELAYFERFGACFFIDVKYFEETILANRQQRVRLGLQMQTTIYLTTLNKSYLLWALGISIIFISVSFPILSTVFTFGRPIENKPDDSMLLTGFIFIGILLNEDS